jgi:hypothetical protein
MNVRRRSLILVEAEGRSWKTSLFGEKRDKDRFHEFPIAEIFLQVNLARHECGGNSVKRDATSRRYMLCSGYALY